MGRLTLESGCGPPTGQGIDTRISQVSGQRGGRPITGLPPFFYLQGCNEYRKRQDAGVVLKF